MFREQLIAWLYEQLRRSGYYDVMALRILERRPYAEASKIAERLFYELPPIERNDIRANYLTHKLEKAAK